MLRMKGLKLHIFLVVMACNAACGYSSPADCGRYCSMPLEQQHAESRDYPVEKQLDIIHVCRHQSAYRGGDSDPPGDEVIDLLADRGESAISPLIERLRVESDENRQRELIAIFRSMGMKGHLRGRRDVADLVSEKAANWRGDLTARLLEDEAGRKRREQWARDVSEEIRRNAGPW